MAILQIYPVFFEASIRQACSPQERNLRLCEISDLSRVAQSVVALFKPRASGSKPIAFHFYPAKEKWKGGRRERRNGEGRIEKGEWPSYASPVIIAATLGGQASNRKFSFPQYIHPADAVKLGQAELVVIDEAAAIPLPLVKSLLGPYLVFMASTING